MQLPKPSLRIVEDKPGECLALESDAVSVPPALRALVTGLVGSVARIAGVTHPDQWWRTHRLRVDRAAGTLIVDDIQMLDDEARSETIALAEISLVTVRTRHVPPMKGSEKSPPFGPAHPRHVEILVSVGEGGAAARVRRLHFAVEGMDTLEKVADLAYRLGAVLGLHHQRFVRRDPRRVEIEMAAMAGADLEDLPRPEAPSDYTRDVVFPGAESAAAGPTRLGAVDPAHFPGDSRITLWAPGDEVRFDTPAQGMALGCVPMAMGSFLLGPAVWYLFHDVTLTVTLSVVGILVGAVAVFGLVTSLPRHVRLAWREQEMTAGGLLRRRRIRLDRIAGIEILGTRVYYDPRNRQAEHQYRCSVRAEVRGEGSLETRPVDLVCTRSFTDDPETPYDAVLPIAKELADTLGVPWRVTDYA